MDTKFKVYDYDRTDWRDYCNPRLHVEKSVYPNTENLIEDMTALLSRGASDLTKMLVSLKKVEDGKFQMCREMADDWVKTAKEMTLIQMALEYLNTPEIDHTSNEWVKEDIWSGGYSERISNRVYTMEITFYSRDFYKEYRVNWWFGIAGHKSCNGETTWTEVIAEQNKKFADKEKALKYIEGRKKAYAKYFKEINPVIPHGYEGLFKVNGVLLPNYRTEETEGEENA